MAYMKHCNNCQKDSDRYLDGRCKVCTRKVNSAWRKANAEHVKSAVNAWHKANPEKIKATQVAWQAANKEKVSKRKAVWRKVNAEAIKTANAAWKKANQFATRIYSNNRRARTMAAGGKLSSGLSAKLLGLQKGKCACCNQPLGEKYHLDHIMPLVLGGTNTDDNIQLLRQRCNNQKHAKHPVDFMQSRGFLL